MRSTRRWCRCVAAAADDVDVDVDDDVEVDDDVKVDADVDANVEDEIGCGD